MDHIFEHYKKTGYLHHAHVIKGSYQDILPDLLSALARNMGILIQKNPNLFIEEYQSFGIDEGRALALRQSRAGFATSVSTAVSPKIFIIGASSFTHQAQNALLKTFEEPTAGTHFFIILPRTDILLATLKSRVMLVSPQKQTYEGKESVLAEKFLQAHLEDRFALAKKLADAKDREAIHRMLDHLERILYTRTAGKRDMGGVFHDIYQTKTYLMDSGSSPKMLLENLAIAIPSPLTSTYAEDNK